MENRGSLQNSGLRRDGSTAGRNDSSLFLSIVFFVFCDFSKIKLGGGQNTMGQNAKNQFFFVLFLNEIDSFVCKRYIFTDYYNHGLLHYIYNQ